MKRVERWLFWTCVALTQIFGVCCVILAGLWGGVLGTGYEWNNIGQVRNYHSLLMTLGTLVVYGDAIIVFRVFRDWDKFYVKIVHTVMLIVALLLGAVGWRAVVQSRLHVEEHNIHTLHSWLGIAAFVGFAMQWVAGVLAFLIPQTPQKIRANYLGFHTAFGLMIHVLVVVVCVCGINERNMYADNYMSLEARELIGNSLGICTTIFGGFVFFLVLYTAYKRGEPKKEKEYYMDDSSVPTTPTIYQTNA